MRYLGNIFRRISCNSAVPATRLASDNAPNVSQGLARIVASERESISMERVLLHRLIPGLAVNRNLQRNRPSCQDECQLQIL